MPTAPPPAFPHRQCERQHTMARKKKVDAVDELADIADEFGTTVDEVERLYDEIERFEAELERKRFKPPIREQVFHLLRACERCRGVRDYVAGLYNSLWRDRPNFDITEPEFKRLRHALFFCPELNGLKWDDVEASLREYWARWAAGEDSTALRDDATALANRLQAIIQHFDRVEREMGFRVFADSRIYRKRLKNSLENRKKKQQQLKEACLKEFDNLMKDPGMWQAKALRTIESNHTTLKGREVTVPTLISWLRKRRRSRSNETGVIERACDI